LNMVSYSLINEVVRLIPGILVYLIQENERKKPAQADESRCAGWLKMGKKRPARFLIPCGYERTKTGKSWLWVCGLRSAVI